MALQDKKKDVWSKHLIIVNSVIQDVQEPNKLKQVMVEKINLKKSEEMTFFSPFLQASHRLAFTL